MRLPFRADIEGLRAVAILLVVCAHAGVPWLAGGFVGVDVFFVLSGYLITGLLLREIEATGGIRFASFYARRLQRLLPALCLAMLATAIGATMLLAPFEQIDQATTAGAAVTWTSNLHFALAQLDYFGGASDKNLFLHTWSLGVEEQFYLLWPGWMLFLLGAWQWQGRQMRQSRLTFGLAATVAVCFVLGAFLTYAEPQLGFYMVFSRGWQFALGGLVFIAADRGHPEPRLVSLEGWAGIAAILSGALLFDGTAPYPGYHALLPTFGTALLLHAGTAKSAGFCPSKFLSTRPMQWIGRISYGWYLWHWPVLLLGWTLLDRESVLGGWILVAISLVLAVVSYASWEAPIRRSALLRQHPTLVLVTGIVVMMTGLLASRQWLNAANLWSNDADQRRFIEVRSDLPSIYAMGCDEWYHTARVRICAFGPDDAPHTAVLMGDSIAGQWFPAVAGHLSRSGWRLLVITKSACPMVDKAFFYARIGRQYTECEHWRNAAIASLHSLNPDLVLLSSAPTYEFSLADWENGTARVLRALAGTSPKIGIIAPPPILPFDGPACLARVAWLPEQLRPETGCTAPAAREDPITAAINRAMAEHPTVRLLDLSPIICPEGTCRAERDGIVVYRDSQHLTASFSATLDDAMGDYLVRFGLLDPKAAGSDAKRHTP